MNKRMSELTLEQVFADSLTDTPCVYLNKNREVWVATELCVQYLESSIDSIVVRDDEQKLIGIVGGYDLLNHIRKNPTRDFQYENKVEDIMFKELPIVEKETELNDLIERWKSSRRAFAITPNAFQGYSPISARKMLEVGIKCKTDISISSMPKKRMITFQSDDTVGDIIESMFEHNIRKLLLEYSNQFISDRLILGEISRILKFEPDVDNFLDIPINQIELEHTLVIKEDLSFNELCSKMYKLEHPYAVYKDISVSPWDVCLTLLSDRVIEPPEMAVPKKAVCPHCGKEV